MIESFQRQYLRGLAHDLKPVVLVGEDGLTDSLVHAVDDALAAHELIKVRMRRPEDKKGLAQTLAERTGSELCALIGHTIILYRRHPEKPRVHVPQRM